jgi:AcrR family transcriptional regulator
MARGEAPAERSEWKEEGLEDELPVSAGAGEELGLRADARRNRAQILRAAETVFARKGPGAPIDEVAREAGLGVGTLYRHFPTKEALFEAIVLDRMQGLLDEAKVRIASADPGSALFAFLARVFDQALATKALSSALANAGVDLNKKKYSPVWQELWRELVRSTERLLTRAQRAGLVRPDVDVEDLMAMVGGTAHAMEQSDGTCSAERILAVVCDGLRAARTQQAQSARRRRRSTDPGTPGAAGTSADAPDGEPAARQ